VALASYRTQTRRLLQNPGAPSTLYSTPDVDSWINTARGQVAAEGECIRRLLTLTLSVGVTAYNFSSFTNPFAEIGGVMHVRSAFYTVGGGKVFINPHSWEWYQLYYMNKLTPASGAPTIWAQYGQGSSPAGVGSGGISDFGGSLYVYPKPDSAYVLTLDCVCYPIPLIDDNTDEALPYMWTDCVPFFAAWYALLSSQMQARRQDAEAYYGYYQNFAQRARAAANPVVNRSLYEQSPNQTQMNKLGLQQPAGKGGG
jgi:hypothetical protein